MVLLFIFGVVLSCTIASPSPVFAAGRVQFLSDRLRYPPADGQPDDFRVRTNAALALGATNDGDAVAPLCRGLEDPNDLVRQAAAVALKRLARPAAVDCLRRRAAVETVAAAKDKMQSAIEACEPPVAGPSSAPASARPDAFVAGAKYYVSISPVANGTARARAEIEPKVRGAIASRLADLGEYQVAPSGESSETAKANIGKRKLKGFYLAVSLERFDDTGGALRVRIKIAVFSYPGKDLRGEVPAEAAMPGAHIGDSSTEDQLIGLVAARAAELFAENFR
ncbi:MAG TPA: HEAT repeat domain-containing protein [Polyangiaceae bacterium]